MQKEYILPLAITQVDSTCACVAGLTNQNVWIRPEPVYVDDIRNRVFRYEYLTEITCDPSNESDARKEDIIIYRANTDTPNIQHENNVSTRINEILDQNIDDIFATNRTVGIVKIKVIDITYGKTLGGKKNYRIIFEDSNKDHNLIIGDYLLKCDLQQLLIEDELPRQSVMNIIKQYSNKKVFLTVSLTKPTPFPGLYNGCHAIAAGLHVF